MTDHLNDRPSHGDPGDATEYSEDGISLKALVETLWAYRRIISAAVLGVAAIAAVAALAAVLILPSERLGSIQFRLTFEGAADGKYPNGMPFSSAEIIGAPILNEVVRVNDLDRYGGYQALRDAIFILQSNPELQLLTDEYQARLADTKLSVVDRSRVEEEFKKKREALKDPTFTLSMRRNERVGRMPPELMEKTLIEALATWAKQAVEEKGANLYNVPVLSRNVLRADVLEAEDYLVAVDILRLTVIRIISTASQLDKLPGAQLVRTGKERISLAEIKANLEDVERFELEPLIHLIRAEDLTKDPPKLSRYVSGQVFQLKLRRDATLARIKATQDALQDYTAQRGSRSVNEGRSAAGATGGGRLAPGAETTTMIPQLGEGFLDRLIQMSTQTQVSDVQYRQRLTDAVISESRELASLDQEFAFYGGLETSLKSVRASAGSSADSIALVKTRMRKSFDAIGLALDRIVNLHRDLSLQNLTPAMLYVVTGPFTLRTVRSLPLRTAELYWLLALMVTVILVPTGCLIHNAFSPKASTPQSGPATVS